MYVQQKHIVQIQAKLRYFWNCSFFYKRSRKLNLLLTGGRGIDNRDRVNELFHLLYYLWSWVLLCYLVHIYRNTLCRMDEKYFNANGNFQNYDTMQQYMHINSQYFSRSFTLMVVGFAAREASTQLVQDSLMALGSWALLFP